MGTGRAIPIHSSRGFSFVEVLFAVMILGIGFIMLAAIFPVTIQQAQSSSDETTSAAVAWNAFNLIQETLGDEELPPMGWHERPGMVRSFRNPQAARVPSLSANVPDDGTRPYGSSRPHAIPGDRLWQRVSADMVVADDPRFAWVGFYRRGIGSDVWRNHAMLIVVVARVRDGTTFELRDVSGTGSVNLQPRPVTFDVTSDGQGPLMDQAVVFTGGMKDAVSEGAFLIIADDPTRNDPWPSEYESGRVYRIGNHVEGDKWELSPDSPYMAMFPRHTPPNGSTLATGITGASGFVVGRPAAGASFDGPVQDVAVYSLTIGCRPQMPPP